MNSPQTTPGPRIRSHRASAGLGWVQRGLRLFSRHPLVLAVLVGLGPLLLLTLKVVPALGDLVSYLLTPAVILGMLTVCRSVREGTPAGISSYLAALHDPATRLRLLQLGAYYAVFGGLVTLALSFAPEPAPASSADLPLNGNLIAAAPGPPAPAADQAAPPAAPAAKNLAGTPDFAANPISLPVFFELVAIVVPFMMTIWFAPALCGWYHMPAPKALFFSFFACWRNRAAMLVYLVTLLGIWVIAVLILASLIDLLNATAGLAPYLLLAPLLFLMMAIAQAANLAMVQDVIDDGTEPDNAVIDTTILPPS
jgi:hypothetical protein